MRNKVDIPLLEHQAGLAMLSVFLILGHTGMILSPTVICSVHE